MSCTKKLPLAIFVSHLSMFTPLFVGPSDSHSTGCHDLTLMLDLLLCHLGHHHGSSLTSVFTYINACNFLHLDCSLQCYHSERKLFSLGAGYAAWSPDWFVYTYETFCHCKFDGLFCHGNGVCPVWLFHL